MYENFARFLAFSLYSSFLSSFRMLPWVCHKIHEKEKYETVAKEYKEERKENKKRNVYHKKHSQVVS